MPTETFETVVSRLGLQYHLGLQAISRRETSLITATDTHSILGSVNLDEDLQSREPNAHRWDYVVAYSEQSKALYFIEIHPAGNDSNAKEVARKKEWLDRYLASEGQTLKAFTNRRFFYWVVPPRTDGTRGFVPPKGSRINKIFSEKGVRGPVATLKLE